MIALRPYAATDRAAVSLVFYRAVREGAAAFYTEAERAAWAPDPSPDLTRPDKFLDQWCHVAERDGQIVGFMSMTPAGYLDMAFVLPEEMGKGTAGLLYDVLLAQARRAGLPRLTVRASHLSHRFLSRRGWTVDQFERYAADGQVYDLFHMSLVLAEQS